MRLAIPSKNGTPLRVILGLVLLSSLLLTCALAQAEPAPAAQPGPEPLIHQVKAGDNLIKICKQYRDRSNHYSLSDLLGAIRRTNNLQTNVLQIGQKLVIPVLPPENPAQVSGRVQDGAELRGMYLTGPACGLGSVWRRVDAFIAAGGNAVVFDAKDIDGGVSFASKHPLASWGKGRSAPVISSLPEMMARLDRRGVYVVARVALFLDGELGRQRPDLALPDAQGQPWAERGCTWIDPRQPQALDYNLTLARELAAAGVDEIQFDYMRFPTNGWQEDWNLAEPDTEATAQLRRQAITAFLQAARDTLAPFEVKVSADLYGIMAWGRVEDLALTGQHVPTIASLVDVICPMIYPSHFAPGFEGHRRPGDAPGHFIGEGTRRFAALADGQAQIRPWLQAFPYRVTRYDGQYIEEQVLASREAGGQGWCLWNPACRYQVAMGVMPGLDTPQVDPAGPVTTAVVVASLIPSTEAETQQDQVAAPTVFQPVEDSYVGSMVAHDQQKSPSGPPSPPRQP